MRGEVRWPGARIRWQLAATKTVVRLQRAYWQTFSQLCKSRVRPLFERRYRPGRFVVPNASPCCFYCGAIFRGPRNDEAVGSRWQLATQQCQRVELKHSLILSVHRMKVGWVVIPYHMRITTP